MSLRVASEYHCDCCQSSRCGCWSRQTHLRPIGRCHALLLLSLGRADSQYHWRCGSEVVHLRLAAGPQLLKGIPGHRMAFNRSGHCVQLPRASVNTVRLCASRGKLELWISWKKALLG